MSGRGLSSSPHGLTQPNEASFSTDDEMIRVQFVLKCMLLVGDAAVKPGYTSGVPNPTLSVVVRLKEP